MQDSHKERNKGPRQRKYSSSWDESDSDSQD